jgi:hypothetical protein
MQGLGVSRRFCFSWTTRRSRRSSLALVCLGLQEAPSVASWFVTYSVVYFFTALAATIITGPTVTVFVH